MNSEELTALMHIIPDNDENCDLKRAEIARWYKVYGKKILYPLDMDKVMNVLTILMVDNHSWNHNRLNNLTLGKNLLKRIDIQQTGHNLTSHLYDFACLLCLEDDIRTLFYKLDESNKSYKEGWTTEEFVSDILSRSHYGPLVKFWSHYINVVGVENPSPIIVSSFRKILSEYSGGSDINNIGDIWKCGFECAKKEGSREALEFFWNKIEHRYSKEEREKILFDIGLHASSLCSNNENNSFNLIEFSLNYLDAKKYKDFIIQDHREKKWDHVISILVNNYAYDEAKKLIESLDSDETQDEDYDFLLISDTLESIHNVPPELRKLSFEFFEWLWKLEKFASHKQNCLNDMDNIFQSLLKSPELPIPLDVTELILNSLSKEQATQAFRFYPGRRLCGILYTHNERELLQNKILKFFKDGDKFIEHVNALTLENLQKCKELQGLDINEIFNLYIQKKPEDFIKLTENKVNNSRSFFFWLKEFADTVFGDMMNGKVRPGENVSSQFSRISLKSTGVPSR